MGQVAPFTALVLFVAWVAPPTARAQTPARDSLIYAACIPVYVDEFKQKGSDEQRAPLMASMLCQIVAGGCQNEPRGAPCKKSIRHLSESLERSGLSLPYMAASAGRSDLIKTLIELKVDINKPTKASRDSASGEGWTPLMIAAAEGHAEAVSALVEGGADVNATNALGRTALMFASSYGFLPIVNDLLVHRADPNIVPKDSTGWTALIAAAHNGHREVVTMLLGHGADASIADKQGKTALAWAEARGHVEVAQALRDLTAKK
jgi:ankyrin repeat protein